jgi:hypothetical protein
MTVPRSAIRFAFTLVGTAIAAMAHAHPGHGAPPGHTHGLVEALVLVGAVVVGVLIIRGKR